MGDRVQAHENQQKDSVHTNPSKESPFTASLAACTPVRTGWIRTIHEAMNRRTLRGCES
jgi:hypothetical protein